MQETVQIYFSDLGINDRIDVRYGNQYFYIIYCIMYYVSC